LSITGFFTAMNSREILPRFVYASRCYLAEGYEVPDATKVIEELSPPTVQ
jgi:hypothetical protein